MQPQRDGKQLRGVGRGCQRIPDPPEWVMSSLKSAAGVWSEDDKFPVASRVPNQSAAFR